MVKWGTTAVIESIDYSNYSNRQLLVVPVAVFCVSVAVLVGLFVLTGSPVTLGIEFAGGSEIRVISDDVEGGEFDEAVISTVPTSIQTVAIDESIILTFTEGSADISQLESELVEAGYVIDSSSTIAPSFGAEAQRVAAIGLIVAFVGMSSIIFLLFRSGAPSIAVVASAFSDLVVPFAFMGVVGIELTLGTVAALLLIIGYSVDSDVLLNKYILRRQGEFYESVYGAMETGVTMTLTSLLAMSVMTVAAAAYGVPLLRDIGLIITVGLLADLMNTYLMNVAILRWYKFEGIAR